MPVDALIGRRIVESGDSLAAAVAGYHLALAGADVVVMEPAEGCWLRVFPSSAGGDNVLWETYGRGKRSVVADTHGPEAFVQRADVLIGSGIGARADHQVFVEIDTEGSPDLFHQARSGFLSYLGSADAPPVRAGFEVTSFATGVAAVQAVAAALLHRERSGEGQSLSVSPERVTANLIGNQIVSRCEPDEEISFAAYHRVPSQFGFRTADGWVELIFFRDDGGWDEFCQEIGEPALAADPRFARYPERSANKSLLEAELAPALQSRTNHQVVEMVRARGGFAVEKTTPAVAATGEQAAATGLAGVSGGRVVLNSPWTVDGARGSAGPPPALGEHTAEVTRTWSVGREVAR